MDLRAALSVACKLFPQVVWNAFLAALTARSTSSFVAWEKSRKGSSVAGLRVEKVSLDDEVIHSLLLGTISEYKRLSLRNGFHMKRPVGTVWVFPEGSVMEVCVDMTRNVVQRVLYSEVRDDRWASWMDLVAVRSVFMGLPTAKKLRKEEVEVEPNQVGQQPPCYNISYRRQLPY